MIPLKPCPWSCPRKPFVFEDGRLWAVKCDECGCVGPLISHKQGAEKAWNKRSPDAAVEAVKKAHGEIQSARVELVRGDNKAAGDHFDVAFFTLDAALNALGKEPRL